MGLIRTGGKVVAMLFFMIVLTVIFSFLTICDVSKRGW